MWVGRFDPNLDAKKVEPEAAVTILLRADEAKALKALVGRDKDTARGRTLASATFEDKLDLALEMLGIKP